MFPLGNKQPVITQKSSLTSFAKRNLSTSNDGLEQPNKKRKIISDSINLGSIQSFEQV